MHDLYATTAPPRLNEPAPNFEADTTHGPRRLEDYAGRWLVLFSHPADFTPVCTSEFVAFARLHPQFEAIGCDLLGLSVDSLFAHIAWIRGMEQTFGVTIPFPVIEDVSMRIAGSYGMVHPGESDTAAVRSTFVIDPDGVVRATINYPMTVGRSAEEILRLVQALQTSAEHRVATPEGWRPGMAVVDPPPQTTSEASARVARDGSCPEWYFAERELPRS